ncbi:MAG TPA: DNA-directed RNA polymerase subunit RpoH/Rpb5 C-terminal domain-containing protein [Candidatus Bilamarchaeaceae archaeon]|nr:DNA-directed RNA polymerase subunit RpoH/Rpb5 C-terminal domain-containing protein [Candidatus Bilamarchaeaceae archaeon]
MTKTKDAKKQTSSKKEKKPKKEERKVDVLGHALVPKMEITSDAEKKSVLSKYKIVEKQLPKLKSSDPEAKSLNANVGDLIKIHRDDSTGKYFSYRLVVD